MMLWEFLFKFRLHIVGREGKFMQNQIPVRKVNTEEYMKIIRSLLEEGKEITDNRVTIRVTDSACISSGVLEIVEKTGKEVPCEKP